MNEYYNFLLVFLMLRLGHICIRFLSYWNPAVSRCVGPQVRGLGCYTFYLWAFLSVLHQISLCTLCQIRFCFLKQTRPISIYLFSEYTYPLLFRIKISRSIKGYKKKFDWGEGRKTLICNLSSQLCPSNPTLCPLPVCLYSHTTITSFKLFCKNIII